MLVLLYYLSQNPDFTESAKPLMEKLKDSQQMLSFLNDLSRFTQTFSTVKQEPQQPKKEETPPKKDTEKNTESKKENPQSPTSGIADEFIQNILESYLKKR